MFENQSITDFVFLHWLELVLDRILSSTCLLCNLELFGFGLFSKFSLWFLREINACLSAIFSILSFMLSLAVIWFNSRLMLSLVWSSAFHESQISNLQLKICFLNIWSDDRLVRETPSYNSINFYPFHLYFALHIHVIAFQINIQKNNYHLITVWVIRSY